MRIIDLSVELFEGCHSHPAHGRAPLILPGTASHGMTSQRKIKDPYGDGWVSVANEYVMLTGHTGTHVDAPHHVDHLSQVTVERIDLSRTFGTALWLDLSDDSGPRRELGVESLEKAETQAGETIQRGDILLIHTGWMDANIEDPKRWVDESPGLTREAGEWLRERGIKALGVDLVSPDLRTALDLPVHRNFLKPDSLGLPPDRYILIFEGLRNISTIPKHRFKFCGFPLPLRQATGSPVRAVALVEDSAASR